MKGIGEAKLTAVTPLPSPSNQHNQTMPLRPSNLFTAIFFAVALTFGGPIRAEDPSASPAPAATTTPTAAEILATQAAVKKEGPRVPHATYSRVVPAYVTKGGILTEQGAAIVGTTTSAAQPASSPETVQADGTRYSGLLGKWKTGQSSTGHIYEFKAGGEMIRHFPTFSGKDSKYSDTRTEAFIAEEKEGKIVIKPKGGGEPNQWFEISVPFNPAAPAGISYRVSNGQQTETPFTFVKAPPSPERQPGPVGTVQRTIAKTATVMRPDKRRYFQQGSPVDVAQDRINLPEWASEIVIQGRGRGPEERWIFPTAWLTDGAPFAKPSQGFNPVFPPSKRLTSQYLEVAQPLLFSGPRQNFVLLPGAQLRAIKHAQTGAEYGNVPGIEVRDRDGLKAVLPESAFLNAASFQPLAPVKAALAGAGTEQSPFLVRSKEDFLAFAQDPTKWQAGVHTRFETDLDLSDTEFDEVLIAPLDRDDGLPFDQKPAFQGILDGNEKNITGLKIVTDRPYADAALFYEIGSEGIVKNVRILSAEIQTQGLNARAAILCLSNKGKIEDCQVTGTVKVNGAAAAGLCLDNLDTGKILRSFVGGDGKSGVSGFQAGGISHFNKGLISECGADAILTGNLAGEIASNNEGTVRNCFAAGTIPKTTLPGGLCGSNEGTIEFCFSRTRLESAGTQPSQPGGLVGKQLDGGTVTSSYWDKEFSGATQSQGGEGISTAQSKETATFAGWDFQTVWEMGTNGPQLRRAAPKFY